MTQVFHPAHRLLPIVVAAALSVAGAGFAADRAQAAAGQPTARASSPPWQPSPGHVQTPIWPGTPPDALPHPAPESDGRNVSRPTMTVYRPAARATGVGVVVFPGGGYQMVAMGLEGTEICDWLTARGITCLLLKYRVPDSGPTMKDGRRYYPRVQTALQDAQRTLGLVRLNAARYGIDPHRLGVMSFSAGGHLVAAISTHPRRTYPAVDAADAVSCRPDFAVAVYPGHLWVHEDEPDTTRNPADLGLHADIRPTAATPPTFLVQAQDDDIDGVSQSLAYYVALNRVGVPVEMHLYAHGGHAFGLRRTDLPIGRWPLLVEQWLHTIGMLGQ